MLKRERPSEDTIIVPYHTLQGVYTLVFHQFSTHIKNISLEIVNNNSKSVFRLLKNINKYTRHFFLDFFTKPYYKIEIIISSIRQKLLNKSFFFILIN